MSSRRNVFLGTLGAVGAFTTRAALAVCPENAFDCPTPTYKNVTLSGNAALPLEAPPLQQVLPLTGGTVTGPINVEATGAPRFASVQDRFGEVVDAKLDYGAKGDGVTDDTAAIQAAINTGKALVFLPAGTYLVSDALNITTQSQVVYGAGIGNTIIKVPATFNLAARGVFSVLANAGNTQATITNPGPAISDLVIIFAQIDTSTKTSLIQFPPAIFITNTLRWRVERVQVEAGWNGIYAVVTGSGGFQNSVGGGYVDDFRSGCLNTNIYIDGSTDTLRITKAHIWPFGLTSNQQIIFYDQTMTTGIVLYRADDYIISDSLFFVGLGVFLGISALGSSYGTMVNIDFDTYSGIQAVAGSFTISSTLFLVGANYVGLAILGSVGVTASAVSFSAQSPGAAAVNCFPPTGTTATLVMGDFNIGQGATNTEAPAININSNSTPGVSSVTLSNGRFDVDPTAVRGQGIILCQSNSATLVMSGCQINPKAASDPVYPFVQITGNGINHRINGNSSPGWNNLIPIGCAYEYPNFSQQVSGVADLNAMPVPWTGFGFSNYIQAASQANWPPNTGPHITVLDTYTANTDFRVQVSFGFNTDGLWHRWEDVGTWGSWYQIVTTYGGMTMQGNLLFQNNTAIRLLNSAGTGAVDLTLDSSNDLLFNAIAAAGGARNIAIMAQNSDTSPWQFAVPVMFLSEVGFNFSSPIAKPTVTGSKGGNAALASLVTALAAYGLVTDSTS